MIDLLYWNSFADSFYAPEITMKLANKLLSQEPGDIIEIKNKIVFASINDTLIKIGFMMFSRAELANIIGKVPNASNYVVYYLSNFIYATKAYLDAIAVTLNEFYHLGLQTGEIDLAKGRFKQELSPKSKSLANELTKLQSWLEEVISWRNASIHRTSLIVAPYGHGPNMPSTESDLVKFSTNYKMINKPIPFFQLEDLLKAKKGTQFEDIIQDILPFCDRWILNAKVLFENTAISIDAKL